MDFWGDKSISGVNLVLEKSLFICKGPHSKDDHQLSVSLVDKIKMGIVATQIKF